MKSIGYYPGCSLGGTAAEYAHSLKAVAAKMELELKEVPDWVCCGATSAHAVDHTAALCLAADTLAKAKRAGLDEVLAPCAMCYQRLAVATHEMTRKPALAKDMAEALGESADLGIEKVKALSLLNWLDGVAEDEIKQRVTRPLSGLKVACYYGCLLVRPQQITNVEAVEMPRSMERVLTMLGATPVRWSMATECCGASFALSRKESVLRLCKRIVDAARKAGATAICLACPMCHANLDMRQAEFNLRSESSLPVMYLTQLMGMAFGVPSAELGLKGHFVPVEPAIEAALAAK